MVSIRSKFLLINSLAAALLAVPFISDNAAVIKAQSVKVPHNISQYQHYKAIKGENGTQRELYPGGITVNTSDINSREAIRLAQTRLQAQGFYKGPINGELDKTTRKALKKFQDDKDLFKTGMLDYATTDALGLNLYTVSYNAERVITYDLSSSEIIAYAQKALSKEQFYMGPIDGQPNAALTDAIRKFQIDSELPVTGNLDDATAEAMGLHPVSMPLNDEDGY